MRAPSRLAADGLDGLEAAHRRQLQVHQRHVGRVPLEELHRFLAARGRGHHFHVRLSADQQGEAVEHHAVIVDAEHADAGRLGSRIVSGAAWLGGNNGLDVRTFARHGGNDDVAAHLFRAFAHAHQPVVILQPRRFIGIEAAPVVADAKARLVVAVVELDRHGGGAAVTDGVAERLLADEQELFVHQRGRCPRRAVRP